MARIVDLKVFGSRTITFGCGDGSGPSMVMTGVAAAMFCCRASASAAATKANDSARTETDSFMCGVLEPEQPRHFNNERAVPEVHAAGMRIERIGVLFIRPHDEQ